MLGLSEQLIRNQDLKEIFEGSIDSIERRLKREYSVDMTRIITDQSKMEYVVIQVLTFFKNTVAKVRSFKRNLDTSLPIPYTDYAMLVSMRVGFDEDQYRREEEKFIFNYLSTVDMSLIEAKLKKIEPIIQTVKKADEVIELNLLSERSLPVWEVNEEEDIPDYEVENTMDLVKYDSQASVIVPPLIVKVENVMSATYIAGICEDEGIPMKLVNMIENQNEMLPEETLNDVSNKYYNAPAILMESVQMQIEDEEKKQILTKQQIKKNDVISNELMGKKIKLNYALYMKVRGYDLPYVTFVSKDVGIDTQINDYRVLLNDILKWFKDKPYAYNMVEKYILQFGLDTIIRNVIMDYKRIYRLDRFPNMVNSYERILYQSEINEYRKLGKVLIDKKKFLQKYAIPEKVWFRNYYYMNLPNGSVDIRINLIDRYKEDIAQFISFLTLYERNQILDNVEWKIDKE